jgi:uncharacterized membrane protein
MIGRIILYSGYGLILAVVLKVVIGSLVDLLKFKSIDFWSILLVAGCILASIGLGLTKSKISGIKNNKKNKF